MKIIVRRKNAYILIELLAVIMVVALTTAVYVPVHEKYGLRLAVMAGALALLAGVWLIVLLYRWSWSRNRRQLAHLRETYRTIYRVKQLPVDSTGTVKPDGAEIQIGDFGWDARPTRRDGMIHLQGLTRRWQVVWHAGFHPDQIEKVAGKPASQYDYWVPYWAKRPPPPACPFPIRERNTPTMGLPHHSGRYFKEYASQFFYQSTEIKP